MPSGNGAPAALTNTAVANNDPQPPLPPPHRRNLKRTSSSTGMALEGTLLSVSLFLVPARADSNPPHLFVDSFPDMVWTNTSPSSNRRGVAACSFASFVVSPPSHVCN
ncbi:hypothetical protein FRC15_007714 [Serendipita sp. 397]|nr:hypothetical protein FRC15_007714 [Serendipita sp. 397]